MELTISYILKSVIVLLVLYLFYYALLRNQNSFVFNRLYILLAPVIALALPLLKWPVALAPENAIGEALQAIQLTEVTVTAYGTGKASKASTISPALYVSLAYAFGVLLMFFKLAKQLWQLQIVKSEAAPAQFKQHGVKVYQLPEQLSTFAFGNSIFLGKHTHLSKADQEQVMAHELAHIKLRHTWDVLYYELLTAILWANPVIWLLKQELRDVHEYQADARVTHTFQLHSYSALLSKEALLNMGLPVGNYFQKPQVLKRLQMLQQNNKPGWVRPLLALPLVAGLTFIFSAQQVEAQATLIDQLTQKENPAPAEKAKSAISTDKPVTAQADIRKPTAKNPLPVDNRAEAAQSMDTDTEKPFNYVERMPRFKGGEREMLKYLAKNIRYPKASQDAGTEGLVVISFVVDRDGSLSDFQVLKSLDESTDAEALRVVESMNGSWYPGIQNGKAVPVRYTMPVRFAIKN
ncbi:M56 family metallopeptidase [Pontibacter sp. H249]|uniref:M56 family metallopeptidase n=1 Tax=Pontibacter sp. H249 TaxID=3133420 RepID=UPI0030C3549A